MDLASLLGIISGVGLIVLGIMNLGADFNIFVSLPSLLIVGGGSLAATLLSFSMKDVFGLLKSVLAVFKRQKVNMTSEVEEIVELAPVARKSMQELEKSLNNVSDPFLKDGIQLVIDGYNPNDIREIMETRIENRAFREQSEANVLRTMGKYSPAFGMIGTLIGLVVMLFAMSEIAGGGQDPMGVLGRGMGAALITTFYGTIFANLIFNPMAVKFETRIDQRNTLQTMIIEGVLLLHARKHPLIVREKLNSFLRPRDWKRPEEEA